MFSLIRFPHRTPRALTHVHNLVAGPAIWTGAPYDEAGKPVLYLTFDDGPTPGVTPWILEQLAEANAKATFFCLGKNAVAYPELMEAMAAAGHRIGNHSYQHPNGRKTSTADYLKDVKQAHEVLLPWPGHAEGKGRNKANDTMLFRPPYGQMTIAQGKAIRQLGYQVVRWDLIVGDWDQAADAEELAQRTVALLRPGSIIVLHDSEKAATNMQVVLKHLLKHWKGTWGVL